MDETNETSKNTKPYTSDDKWVTAGIAGLLFLLLSSPVAYELSSHIGLPTFDDGTPTIPGLIIHASILVLIVKILMAWKAPPATKAASKDQYIAALLVGLLFMVVSSPYLYGSIDSLGIFQDSIDGVPTPRGLIVHTLIFTLLVRTLVRWNRAEIEMKSRIKMSIRWTIFESKLRWAIFSRLSKMLNFRESVTRATRPIFREPMQQSSME